MGRYEQASELLGSTVRSGRPSPTAGYIRSDAGTPSPGCGRRGLAMNRPIQVHLPASFAMGELIAAQSTVLASLGWDLGMKFDVHMRPIHGSGWVEVLRLDRWEETGQSLYKFKLTLVDPSFTITEPLKNSHSPLRECLPRTQAFFDLLESTWRIRNAAQHFDPPMTAGLLQDRVKVIGHLSQQAGLALATDCKRILERINHIGQGGKVVPPAVVLEDLQSTLASEREATKQLSVQIDQLKKALGEADRSSTQSAELQGEVERLRADLIAAEAERSLAVDSLGTT